MKKILTILFILFAAVGYGQIYSNPNPTMYGIQYTRFKPTLVLHVPHVADTTSIHTNDTTTQIVEYNGTLYYHLGTGYWVPLGSAGGGGGGDIRDTSYLARGFGIYIDNIPERYQPNLPSTLIAVDTSVIATKNDILIITNADTAVFIVDSIANAPTGSEPPNTKYLVGTSPTGIFAPYANHVAVLVGAVWTYTAPTSQQQLIVDDADNPTTWQYNGIAWALTTILVKHNYNRGIGSLRIGTFDKQTVTLSAWNKPALVIDTTRDVIMPKMIGTPSTYYASWDSTTGRFISKKFTPLGEGTNITFTYSGDSTYINSAGGSAGTTADETQTATASQTAFTFTDVPADFEDYIMFVWGVAATPTTDYTTSGDVVTFTTGLTEGSLVRFKRIK